MRSTLLHFFIALILVTLGACAPIVDPPEPIAEPLITPEAGLTPRERNVKALGLLEVGKAREARVELEASLAELPANRNATAQNLISQIDDDPVDMLGSKYFKYEVAKGESLSLIADRFLGDKFKFYVLARYNGLDNPSLVKAGDVIKVPGVKPNDEVAANPPPEVIPTPPVIVPEPPVAVAPTPEPSDPVDGVEVKELLAKTEENINAGNYEVAIFDLEKGLAEFPDSKAVKDRLAGAYVTLGGAHIEQQKYEDARSAFQRASGLNPGNKNINARLAEAGRAIRSEDLYREGQKYANGNAVINAYESYNAALKVWPAHDRAQIELAKIRPEVAELYYRQGLIALQGNDLELALEMFEKTLEVDPRHKWGDLKRQYTRDLLDRLNTIPARREQSAAAN